MNPRRIAPILILLMVLPAFASLGESQETGQSAELTIYPIGQIPAVTPYNHTTIPLQFIDTFGINWTVLRSNFPLLARVIWPIFRKAWRPFLGYCSITFSTEIVGDTTSGWTAAISPTAIANSTDGTMAKLNLNVTVNNLAAASTVIIRIRADRLVKGGAVYGSSYFDIPARSVPLNFVDVKADTPARDASPGSIVPFQITVRNLGYFVDTFAVKVTNLTQGFSASLSDQSFVLQPAEARTVVLYVGTPDNFYDPGKPYKISFTAYSIQHPGYNATAAVSITSRGVFVSQALWVGIGGVALVVILLVFVIFLFIERRAERVNGKPVKPWKIPEEQLALYDLKQTNPQAYDQERAMMVQEYKSALDYYRDSRHGAHFQTKESTAAPRKPLFAPLTQRLKTLRPRKKSTDKPKQKTKAAPAPITTTTSTVDADREKALQRIQKEQAKQQRRKK